MKTSKRFFRELFNQEQGAAAVEYALLISCIVVAIAGSVTVFGQAVLKLFAFDLFPK
jgi:Flp pilus assembly pilin Flp